VLVEPAGDGEQKSENHENHEKSKMKRFAERMRIKNVRKELENQEDAKKTTR
jgi:hypothetical protein